MYINTYIATHYAQTQAKTIKEPTDEKGNKITQKLMQMVDFDGVIPGYDIDLVGFQYDEDKVVFEGCQVKLRHNKRGPTTVNKELRTTLVNSSCYGLCQHHPGQ